MRIENIQKITTLATEDMNKALADIRKANEVMNFFDTLVNPYSFAMPISDLVRSAESFSKCDKYSRQILRAEINGLIEILNHWIDLHNEPKVEVEYLLGKKVGLVESLPLSTVEFYEEVGFAKRV